MPDRDIISVSYTFQTTGQSPISVSDIDGMVFGQELCSFFNYSINPDISKPREIDIPSR